MDSAINSNIRFLSKIFHVDLTTFISTELTNENLIEYYPIAKEIIESLKQKDNSIDASDQLTKSCDKILSVCISALYLHIENPILLKYLKECVPHCSVDIFNKLNEVFVVNFIKLAQSKGKSNSFI